MKIAAELEIQGQVWILRHESLRPPNEAKVWLIAETAGEVGDLYIEGRYVGRGRVRHVDGDEVTWNGIENRDFVIQRTYIDAVLDL